MKPDPSGREQEQPQAKTRLRSVLRDGRLCAVSIMVRAAVREDVAALVRLRLANAERHIQLDPAVYRLPDVEFVRRYFEDALSAGSDVLIFVADIGGEIVGTAEVVPLRIGGVRTTRDVTT
jgi:hypothetical protein